MNPFSERNIAELVERSIENGLVLVVGSGINGKAVPQWSDLLGTLVNRALTDASIEDDRVQAFREQLALWCRSAFDPAGLAAMVKFVLGNARYRAEIQDVIYRKAGRIEDEIRAYCQQADQGKCDKFAYLRAVADLASKPAVRAVATFNFDTLLETAIAALGKRTPVAHFGHMTSKFDPALSRSQQEPEKPVLPVYHVHGLLWPPDSILRSSQESVVFAYDEYFEANADPLAWETSTVIHLIRNHCTLWLGASLRDWNMLRLLDAARGPERTDGQAYCLQCLEEIRPDKATTRKLRSSLDEFKQVAMRLQATLLQAVGVRLIVGGDTFDALPGVLANQITAGVARQT